MIKMIARGAYLALIAAMIAIYALAPVKGEVPDPQSTEPIWVAFA